jgi:hypothetical protein
MAGKRKVLRKIIRQQRTGGDNARVEPDFHRVEAVTDFPALAVEQFEITAGGGAQGLLLGGIDRLRRTDDIDLGAGLHFDKNQDIAVTADQVDLAPGRLVIADQHPVTVAVEEGRSHALTVDADLRRGRQPGRGRAFVSVQTFADELGKGREG